MSIVHEYRDSGVYRSIIEGEYTGRKVYFRELGTDQQGVDICWSFDAFIETAEKIFESTDLVFCSLKKTTPSMAQIKKMFLQLSQIPFDENRLDSIDQRSWDQVYEKINKLIQTKQFEFIVKHFLENNDKINKDNLYKDITKDISKNSQKIDRLFKKFITEVESSIRTVDLFINVYASIGNRGIDAKLSNALKIVERYLYSPNNIQECLNSNLHNLKKYLKKDKDRPFPFSRILVHIDGYIFKLKLEDETVKLSTEKTNFHLNNPWVDPPKPFEDYPALANMHQQQLLSFDYESENPWSSIPSSSQSGIQKQPLSYHTSSESLHYNPWGNTVRPFQYSSVSQTNMPQQVLLSSAWNANSSFQNLSYLEKEKIKEHLTRFKQTSLSYEELEAQTRSFCREQNIEYRNYLENACDLLNQELANSNEEELERINEIMSYIQNILNSHV